MNLELYLKKKKTGVRKMWPRSHNLPFPPHPHHEHRSGNNSVKAVSPQIRNEVDRLCLGKPLVRALIANSD